MEEQKVEIYSPPECAVCMDRAFNKLRDGTVVCSRCEKDILYVNRATNQEYLRCILALQESGRNTAKAIDWITAYVKKHTDQLGTPFEEIMQMILFERHRQDYKFGEQNHDDLTWLSILVEEVGEVAKAILEEDNVRDELIDVAAVAVAWLECRHRKGMM